LLIIFFIVGLSLGGRPLFGASCFEPALESPQSELVSGGQEAKPQVKTEEAQTKAEPEKIVPGPQNIKERTAIYVFLGWMWVSIAVLVYALRLKIKETDRLYFSRYFSPDKK
jgi:hypothetical protein